MRTFQRGLDSLIYPSQCLLCKDYHEGRIIWLCPPCAQKFLERPCPAISQIELGESAIQVFSGWYYDELTQAIVHQLKYQKHFSLGIWLGKKLAERAYQYSFANGHEILVPVPLHRRRLDERGFNQSEKLIEGLLDTFHGGTHVNCLKRIKYTQMQAMLTRQERLQNVNRAFRLRASKGKRLLNQIILLVDDVLTTGATLTACRNCFNEVESRDLKAITLARAGQN